MHEIQVSVPAHSPRSVFLRIVTLAAIIALKTCVEIIYAPAFRSRDKRCLKQLVALINFQQ